MPTLVTQLPESAGPQLPCRWCGSPTDLRFEPDTGSRIGPVPLHMLCSGAFLLAYDRMQRGLRLTAREQERLAAMLRPQLTEGH